MDDDYDESAGPGGVGVDDESDGNDNNNDVIMMTVLVI